MPAQSVFQGLAQEATNKLGRHDDGREGTVLTKIAQGELLRIPVPTTYNTVTGGTGSVSRVTNDATNLDGSGTGVLLNVAAVRTDIAAIETVFWGRVFGLRRSRANFATRYPLAVIIDGEPFRTRNEIPRDMLGALSGSAENESLELIVDDLPDDGPHIVRIGLAGDPLNAQARAANLQGFVVEKAKGNQSYGAAAFIHGSYDGVTVPTTRTSISTTAQQGISRVHFANQSATVTHTATLHRGTNIYARVPLAVAGSAGASADVDFPAPINGSGWSWAVDAGTDVLGTVVIGKVLP